MVCLRLRISIGASAVAACLLGCGGPHQVHVPSDGKTSAVAPTVAGLTSDQSPEPLSGQNMQRQSSESQPDSALESGGNFFPPEYKFLRFKEGDVVAFETKGKYAIERILKIDRVTVQSGQTINIQGQPFTATEDDYLLVVSASFSNPDFNTVEEARLATQNKSWRVQIGHVPRRTTGVGDGAVYLGNYPVTEDELSGYNLWKEAFDKGQAGIF